MTNEKFYHDTIGLTLSINHAGEVTPVSFNWQGKQHTVTDVGRQWTSEAGRHVLVMTAEGSRFELQLSRQDLVWYLKRAWEADIAV
jgi:hypothetical protein